MPTMSQESLDALEEIRKAVARRMDADPEKVTMMISSPTTEQKMQEIATEVAELQAKRTVIEARQDDAVVAAAVAYVAAWRDWIASGGYAPVQREVLHSQLEELVAAVDGLGATDKQGLSMSGDREHDNG